MNLKWFYLRDKTNTRVALVGSMADEHDKISFSVATWNPKDNCNRKLARYIVEQRLVGGLRFAQVPNKGNIKAAIIQYIAESSGDDEMIPARTRDAAKLWVKNMEGDGPQL
jgi:hypothetical protein